MYAESLTGTVRWGGLSNVESEFQQRLRLIELCVELLIGQTKIGELWSEGYEEAVKHLESLPLATDEYNITKQHLDNALSYCHCNEYSAAAFELRMVRGRLQRI